MSTTSTGDSILPHAARRKTSRLVQRAREAFKTTSYGQSVTRTTASLGLLKPRRGHYYSPIPSLKDVRPDAARILGRLVRELPGVDVDDAGQVALLEELSRFYPEQPFTVSPDARNRYHVANSWFAGAAALCLH